MSFSLPINIAKIFITAKEKLSAWNFIEMTGRFAYQKIRY